MSLHRVFATAYHSCECCTGKQTVDTHAGSLSPHYGDIQRERQQWLQSRLQALRDGDGGNTSKRRMVEVDGELGPPGVEGGEAVVGEATRDAATGFPDGGSVGETQDEFVKQEGADVEGIGPSRRSAPISRSGSGRAEEIHAEHALSVEGSTRLLASDGEDGGNEPSMDERVRRMEVGIDLWGATYVPPIDPNRRKYLLEKWSGAESSQDTNSIHQVREFREVAVLSV